MLRRALWIFVLLLLAVTIACTNKKVSNPLANVGSKQPDKVLFNRAMDALKHNRYDVARLTLQTLINTYPDSEYIARAKLGVADSWYEEGGSASMAQAEAEYKDFITFFPNMPEAAEAQLKIANIHYQQMEKPDRDFTHALRAEEEYRQLILQWPDSKLVPQAKQRLLEVQEVIAEREYRVGRFYSLRQSYPAAIARLRSLVERYPLYSKADEALYTLGQSYEGEIALIRSRPAQEAAKTRMIQQFTKDAADAYSRIISRYPLMDRVDDAKARLLALHQPVPRPTKAEVALNKAEEDSRREPGQLEKLLRPFARHPDTTQAAKVGDPTIVDPQPVSASDVVQRATQAAIGSEASGSGNHSVSVETVGNGAPPPDQPAPRSDATPAVNGVPIDNSSATAAASEPKAGTEAPDPNELKPNVKSDENQPLPAPQQVNEIQPGGAADQGKGNSSQAIPAKSDSSSSSQSSDPNAPADDATLSSSRHKKKKGLHKLVPF